MTGASRITRDDQILILVSLTLLAFLLRWYVLDGIPPGWRDDELINSLVISQKALDGDMAVYYADASGHEALYHLLNAIFLSLFGPGVGGIRLLSVILGALTVPMTYLLGRKLFNGTAGLAAALGLTFSFWSLMYSRIGLRHILLPVLALAAFCFFWRGLETTRLKSPVSNYIMAAIFTSLGFYTYFAGRGVPLILLAFGGYVFLFDRARFREHWRGWMLMFGVTAVLTLPLLLTLGRQPESEARVAELAVPLVEARAGNFEPLARHVRITLNMFHSDGDDEWLYNIPHRPVFGPIGALFFWSGVVVALGYTLIPLASRITHHASPPNRSQPQTASLASAFLLFWWLAGTAPGFISVPPASLGHTILAQPAVYLLAALPIWQIGHLRLKMKAGPSTFHPQLLIIIVFSAVFLLSVARRDLPDYFVNWPQRGMVRFLYRADIAELADFLDTNQIRDVGISGLLAGPWDKLAFNIGLENDSLVRARWFNPERAILLEPATSFTSYPGIAETYGHWYEPVVHPKWGEVHVGGYTLNQVVRQVDWDEPVCFRNGLCAVTAVYHRESHILELGWRVARPLDLPPTPLISNPPPPGVYAGSRLRVFGQLWDAGDNFLTGDDGLWVDPTTLQPGDRFLQQHWLTPPDGSEPKTAVFGLYDPKTGARILTEDGQEFVQLPIGD